jgi:thymidylate synthase ThyX
METKRPTVPAAEEVLGLYCPVLDHGFVALIDYMGTDDSIERAARVSYGYGTRKQSQTRGLIRYLRLQVPLRDADLRGATVDTASHGVPRRGHRDLL